MPRTRATKTAAADVTESAVETSTKGYTLAPQAKSPSKLFVLPSKATPEARIVTLPNPRHARPARYLVCPETGIYEFTKISTPKTTPRSWLIETTPGSEESTGGESSEVQAEISAGADLYLATAVDPLFLLLPALAHSKAAKGSDETKRLFLTSEDHFDKLPEEASHLSEIIRWEKTRTLMESRMAAVCDTVEAGDETMFRLDEKKLLGLVLQKAGAMGEGGLPASMEEKFVKKALEAPIMIQKSQVSTGDAQSANDSFNSQVSTPRTESADSQTTVATTDTEASSVSQPSTAATSFTEEQGETDHVVRGIEASSEITKLQRQRVAFNFICSSYIAPTLANQLQELLAKTEVSSIDFSPLDEYLTKLAKLRSEALASRSMGHSRKHGLDEEEEEARAEKKRKLEEEKKKKANESRGVRDLKKVNTTGMMKLSHFFKKK